MASNTGNPFSQCLCCIECQDTTKDFQKIIDLKNIGLVIYRHMVEIQDKKKGTDDAVVDTEDVFIIENTKDQEITSAQYLPEIEQNKISCPRCRKIVEHARRLLHTIPNIDKNVVRGICDHCLMEQKSCNECEQIIQKFLSKSKELPENTKNVIKHWLSKVKQVFKSIDGDDDDDDNIRDFKQGKTRASSDLYIDRLLIKSAEKSREPHVKQLFLPQTSLSQKKLSKGQVDDQIVLLEERNTDDQPTDRVQYKHLKEKRLRIIESIPPVPIHSKEELLEGSIEHVQPLTQAKSRYPIIKPDDMDQLFGAAYKKKRDQQILRKYHSDESLRTIAEVISETDAQIKKGFSYFFPKKAKYVYPKRFASSSELIKETQDILEDKAEAERKKREMKRLHKLKIQAKKKIARAERKATAKLRDKEKYSKGEKRELSYATFGKLYKRDNEAMYDEFGKKILKEMSPSKTADLKDEKNAKGDTSKGKDSKAKTDRQKDIKEDRKVKEKTEKEKSKNEFEEKMGQGKEQKQKEKEQREKMGKGKVDERSYKEQKQKEIQQKAKDKKGEQKQIQPDKIQKEKKETVHKSTEMSPKEKDGELRQEKQDQSLGASQEKQQREIETKQGNKKEEGKSATKQIDEKLHQDQKQTDMKEKTTIGKEEHLRQEREKTQKDGTEGKEVIPTKAQRTPLGLRQEKQPKEKETVQEIETTEEKAKKEKEGGSAKGKKSKKDKLSKKPLGGEEGTDKQPDDDIAPKSKFLKRNVGEKKPAEQKKAPAEEPKKDLPIEKIKARRASPDDLILRLVKLKQAKSRSKQPKKELKEFNELKSLDKKLRRQHKPHKSINKKCPLCLESDLEFELESIFYEKQTPDFEEIIIGPKIYKCAAPRFEKIMEDEEEQDPSAHPLLFKSEFIQENKIDPTTVVMMSTSPPLTPSTEILRAPKPEGGVKTPQKNETHSKKTGKQAKPSTSAELDTSKGIIRYTLSDRSFIEKGWTMLPTEKIVRKMNIYRMRPAQPEFDWFEHNKTKGQMTYDTGEILAEFDDNGRGRWFYRNGRLALDYYDAEELNANQRFVIWSSGEPDERGRAQPYTILATFDFLGNGIVFDHSGKIRLKYNQTEGIVLDRKIGPVSHWKWHTLNDPPVLQQVMIDTQMAHKDQKILKLGEAGDEKLHPDNEEMLAIEFDNFIKEKSKKLTQSFKPYQIKMKALKINENFSLRVMDQASVYLIYRDGTTNLKLNIGMILDHKEIVDTDTAELGEVSNNLERLPARTDSLAGLQKSVAYAQCFERMRSARERRLRLPSTIESADKLTAAASRPLRPPLRSLPSDSSTTLTRTGYSCSRKPTRNNIYYDNRLF